MVMTEKIQNKALLNIWNETTCIHYPRKLGEKLPNTEVEYLRIHKPMRTSCLSRKFDKFVCFSVFCVPPIHLGNEKMNKLDATSADCFCVRSQISRPASHLAPATNLQPV